MNDKRVKRNNEEQRPADLGRSAGSGGFGASRVGHRAPHQVVRNLFLVLVVVVMTPSPAVSSTISHTHLSYQVSSQETGRVAVDSSTFHNNGVLKGKVTRVHGAYRFPRTTHRHFNRIATPNSPSLNPGVQPFWYSVRLKVQPDAHWRNNEMAVLRHGDSDMPGGDYKMELVRTVSGKIAADCVMHDNDGQGAGYVRGNGGITINDGHWHTIRCSRVDAGTVSLTVDGRTTLRSTHGSLGDVKGPVPLQIGVQHQGGVMKEQFVGKMDDITIEVGG